MMKLMINKLIMKRIVFTLLLLAALLPLSASEKNDSTHSDRLDGRANCYDEFRSMINLRQHGVTLYEDAALLGFRATRDLSVLAEVSSAIAWYNIDGTSEHKNASFALGGGLGYTLFGRKGNPRSYFGCPALDLRVLARTTVGNPDLKFFQYGTELLWSHYYNRDYSLSAAIGFNHTNYRSLGLPNGNTLYFTLGISI